MIAAIYGTTTYADAYFSTAEWFVLVDTALFSSLTVVALNRFSQHINNENEKEAFASLSNILSLYLPVAGFISVFVFIFSKPISYIAAPGFDKISRGAMIRCIRVMSCVPTIVCITSVELAVLRQKKRFAITELKSLFISAIGIVSVLAFGRSDIWNADALSVAYVVSILLYCAVTCVVVSRYGVIRLHKPMMTDEIKLTLEMVLPLVLSYGISSASLMVDKIIASLLGEGAVSQLTYAHSLYRVVGTIFVTNLAIILLTDFNNLMAKKKLQDVVERITNVASTMSLLLIPISVVSIICSNDIVKIVYERGRFLPETTVIVGSVLAVYAINFIPAMLLGIFNQVFYAAGNTKTPMWVSVICIVANFAISLPLVYLIGLPGVAVGTLIASTSAVIIDHFMIRKLLPGYKGCFTGAFLMHNSIAIIPSIIIALFVHYTEMPSFLRFILTTVFVFAVYFGALLLMKETSVLSIWNKARQRVRKS